MNVEEVIKKHEAWLKNREGGEKANFSTADLYGENFSGEDLRKANLSGADLREADLHGANFCEANFSVADLRGANLSEANFSGANLSWADLGWADLRGADLRGANLRGANLSGAEGKFYLACFGRHHAIAAGEHICIGCEQHTIKYWLENYKEIGAKYRYSENEISMYSAWIKIVSENLK